MALADLLTDDMIRILDEVDYNKKLYLDIVKDKPLVYKKVKEKYEAFGKASQNALFDTWDHLSALRGQREAIKSSMVSPSIVGGLVDGALGTGAGIYAAASTAANKAAAKNDMRYYSGQVNSTGRKLSASEQEYVDALLELNAALNSNPKLRRVREKYYEFKYQQAHEYILKNNVHKLKQEVAARYYFGLVRGYKDGTEYYEKYDAMVKKQQNKYKLIFITLIISAIMLVLLGACLIASSGSKADSNMAMFAVGLIIAAITPFVNITIAAFITPKSIRESIQSIEHELKEQDRGPEFCHSCGTFSPAGNSFCTKCGKSFKI